MLNYQVSSGLLVFGFFWIPFVASIIFLITIVAGSYYMLKTFILDKRTGWLVTYIILVGLPFILNFVSIFESGYSSFLSLLPFVSFLIISSVLKLTIHDWIEEAHFKAIRLKETQIRKSLA